MNPGRRLFLLALLRCFCRFCGRLRRGLRWLRRFSRSLRLFGNFRRSGLRRKLRLGVRLCRHWRRYSPWSRTLTGSGSLPLLSLRARLSRWCSRSARRRCLCRSLRLASSSRRRGRRRWRRSKRRQIFQTLGARTHLAIQQQQEHIVRELWILRQLRCDQQFRHLRKRQGLLHLAPLRQIILDLLLNGLLLRRYGEEEHHLRPRRRQQLPCPRRRRCLFSHQPLRQFLGMILNVAPGLDQVLTRDHLLNIARLFFVEVRGQEIHHRRARIWRVSQIDHLLPRLHQSGNAVHVDLCRGPVRMQNLEPAFFLKHPHDIERIVFM